MENHKSNAPNNHQPGNALKPGNSYVSNNKISSNNRVPSKDSVGNGSNAPMTSGKTSQTGFASNQQLS